MRLSPAALAILSLVACGGGTPVPQSDTGSTGAPPPLPAVSSGSKFDLTLECHGCLSGGSEDTCPSASTDIDTLTGDVKRTAVDAVGVKYTGLMTRTTRVRLCEATTIREERQLCMGDLNGHGTFLVTITVPLRGHDDENASVVMKPDHDVHAAVDGVCDSLDNAAVKADYEDGDTLYFETTNGPAGRVLPTGYLVPGTWSQSRRDPDTGYKLVVTAVP